MLLDKYLSKKQKLYIAMVIGGLWIYFRTMSCYALLPRLSILSVVLVVGWIYLYSLDYLFLPIGLLVMILYKLFF